MAAAIIILVILMIAALVCTFLFLLPEKRRPYLNRFWNIVRDFLKMKHLYLEKIFRTLYVIASVCTFVLCIGGGVLAPFAMPVRRNFGQVLLGIIGGLMIGVILAVILLFIIRISYESTMLKITLTDAAKRIQQKVAGEGEGRSYEEPRRRSAPPAPRPVICRRCGARYDPRRGYCPNCDERW